MRMPKVARQLRRGSLRCAKRRSAQRRRPLRVEPLEERDLLASDLGLLGAVAEGEGPDPLVAIRLNAVDPQTFQPLAAVHQGEEFILFASVIDLRPDASGVFGAYLDLLYPSSFFTVATDAGLPGAGQAALVYGSGFGNGISGDISIGLVDELGTFAASSTPPGSGEQLLAGIRLVASQMGEVQITSNAADKLPEHDILLFDRDDPVPTDLVMYGSLTLQILAPLPEQPVDAIADFLVVNQDSTENSFAVLANDKNTTGSPLVITGVTAASSHGEVTIANNGTLLVYTPERGFAGTDQFTYTIMADGEEDTTTVRVQVRPVFSNDARVAYGLDITDRAGRPVSAVTVGDEFVLHVTVEDLRDVPSGVFAAYLDVRYTSDVAEVAGPITYGPAYENDRVGDTSMPGEIDEVGAFSGSSPLGGGAFELFQIPFRAASAGRAVFEADPADNMPNSQTLLFDFDDAIASDDMVFGRAALTVVPGVVAVDDTYLVNLTSAPQSFAVLENDVNFGGGVLNVVAVEDEGLLGTVAVAADRQSVTYTPPAGFHGSEQFTYTFSGAAGSSTAAVTVHLQPTSLLDDQLGIRLATTDLDGNGISSVGAGQEFLVQAYVQDLRGLGIDRGVYAAYFDLLYERAAVHPIQTQVGPEIDFGSDFSNGVRGDGSVPGILNEMGAFQTATTPLGTGESLLLAARFRAAPARGEADSFQIFEDTEAELFVLENDRWNSGMTTFQADPADEVPLSDTLLYDPVEAVPYQRIRYGRATIEITADGGGGVKITSVSAGSAGGSISIAGDGTSLLYLPAANFNGVETFTYSLDGASQIPVSVTVLPVNDAPVAVSDAYRVRESHVLQVAANAGVAANDFDPDGDTLDVRLVDGTSHGTLQLQSDGSFVYIPDENFLGPDSFTYVVADGQLESAITTVQIDVVPALVSIRLEAVDADGHAVDEVVADEPIVVRTLVQDLRSPSDVELGIGAVYLDIAYDADTITPATAADGPLGLDIQFGSAYRNGIDGEVLPAGRLNDIGAFQAELQPLGGDELELFSLVFELNGPRAVDDSYIVAGGTSVNRLNVLKNDAELRWDITLDAQHAANSPHADVLYLDPVEPVPEDDIRYGDITLAARNGILTIHSVTDTASGALVSIESNGVINYEPVSDFTGQDSFSYTVVDGRGLTATATVTLAVTISWQNLVLPTDVNGDGVDSPLDALIIINELNTNGPRELDDGVIDAFLDVNGDGIVSPIDVLIVINRLILKASTGEGEFSATATSETSVRDAVPTSPNATLDAIVNNNAPTPHAARELPAQGGHRPLATLANANIGAVHALRGELEDDEFADLLDAIADDVAPLWSDFS